MTALRKGVTGPTFVSEIDIFQTDTVQLHSLGQLVYGASGEKYRYALVGGSALIIGNLLQGPQNDTTTWDNLVVTTAQNVGDTQVIVTLNGTAALVNEFAEGTVTLSVTSGLIVGTYTIASHAAQTSTTGNLTLNLAEPLRTTVAGTAVSVTTAVTATMRRNQYRKVVQSVVTNPTAIPVGVALTIAAASTYTWIQTAGVCGVLSDNTIMVVGDDVAQSATAGAVTLANGALGRVGRSLSAKYSAGLVPVKLELD